VTLLLLVLALAGEALILCITNNMKGRLVSQVDDLRSAVAQLGVDLGEAVARVEAKVAELGDPDPDLTADIAAIRDASARLDALVASPVEPEPDPDTPVDPTEPETPTDPTV
jgi:outer membrane murein-binding lipoprotein Lpp